MGKDKTSSVNRLQELQSKFQALESSIEDSGTKRALSVINGMVQEIMRKIDTMNQGKDPGITSADISGLYRYAPKMEGTSVSSPLPEGTPAPDFSLPDANGNEVRLSDFRGSSVLLVFYPVDWSPGCSRQLDLYQNEWNEFEKRGVKVMGISVDSIYSHGAWSAVRKISFPLLADFNPKAEVAKKYQVYRESDGFSERALFIVDVSGVIRYSYVSPFIHHIPDIYQLFKKLDEILKPELTV